MTTPKEAPAVVTREPWEVAWEREYPGDAKHFNSTNAQPFRMVRERWRFQRGYEVGFDAGRAQPSVLDEQVEADLETLRSYCASGVNLTSGKRSLEAIDRIAAVLKDRGKR